MGRTIPEPRVGQRLKQHEQASVGLTGEQFQAPMAQTFQLAYDAGPTLRLVQNALQTIAQNQAADG